MSWIEVESKIKVSNVKDARQKLKKFSKFVRTEKKVDDYYALPPHGKYPKKSLRVRDRGKHREVNFKQRLSYKNGVWAKREVEFEVSDINNFFNLIKNFGFTKWMRKTKKTELYETKDGVHIELNFVKGLGWYIEIEMLVKENKAEIERARKKIMKIMTQIGVKKKEIQKFGYTRVLWSMRHPKT